MMAKRLPTLLGLGFLLLALGALAFLWNTIRGISSKAAGGGAPQNIRITNQTDSGFSVSYFTSDKVTGSVSVEGVGTFADIRDTNISNAQKYNLHYFDIRGLKPSSNYILTIENSSNSVRGTTAPSAVATNQSLDPIYSRVTIDQPLSSDIGIVYLNFTGAAAVSALIKPDGTFVVPLNNVRSSGLDSLASLNESSTTTIFIQTTTNVTSTGICNLSALRALPQIQLGRNISCVTASPTPVMTATPTVTSTPGVTSSIVIPAEGEKVEPQAPTFSGRSVPGKIINIEVHSDQVLTGTVKTDTSGNWSWTPSQSLAPGDHSVIVSYIDEFGKKQTLVRNFTVLAAGSPETVLPVTVGTPSGTVLVTPTPNLTKIVTPTPSITKVQTPTTAESDSLVILLTGGVFLVILGAGLIFNYAKRTNIF